MAFEQTVCTVRDTLIAVFTQVDAWFDKPEDVRQYKPASGGWSINQVLEHITLTNHFLMLTLRKWVQIALERAQRGDPLPQGESDLERLMVIGQRGSFGWIRPEHMEPSGMALEEVRRTLYQQFRECLILLERMQGGIGALCRVTMTVNNLGKIDLYQWLYFLAQHARRHVQQMGALETDFAANGNKGK